jgi:hypothetical protein
LTVGGARAALPLNKDDGDTDWDLIGLARDAVRAAAAWPRSGYWSDYFDYF